MYCLETCEFISKEKEEDRILFLFFATVILILGDTGARKSPDNLSLVELVGPDGWKHKWLEENNIEKSILEGLKEATFSATGLIMDFREGGQGIEAFEMHDYLGTSILLGRPSEDDNLPGKHAGISSLADVDLALLMGSQARSRWTSRNSSF